jgi:molecular chaperone GrpE
MTPEAIERVLADFRAWLGELSERPAPPTDRPPTVDLHTLVAQFTALRHEVNLQTKAARTSIEQTGETLTELRDALDELRERPDAEEESTELLKAIVDVYDNLALAIRQVERQRAAIDEPLREWVEGTKLFQGPKAADVGPVAIRPGFWGRLFGVSAGQALGVESVGAAMKEIEARHQRTVDAARLVRSSFDGLIAGYRMSLARADRAIEQAGLEVIATKGEPFDPELMEVVDVAGDTGRPAGEVIEEVRRGYRRGDAVFRFAQVKVAR